MRISFRLALVFVGVLAVAAPTVRAADAPPPARKTFYMIPHTHWEGAVFKTREEYLEIGMPNILRALQLLKKYPEYRFVLDQVAYVKPFLERFPEEAPAFRKFVKEGRLQLVLGMDVMPDVNMPGGETFVRQMQYGKGYYRDTLGVDTKLAWLVDTFGHHGQLPQLLKLAGYDSFWFSRGVPKADHPSEFAWEGIDGTRIDAYYLPFSYVLLYGAGPDPEAFKGFVQQRFSMLDPNARGSLVRAGATGADVTEPESHYPPTVAKYNTWAERPIDLRFGTPGDYEAAYNKAHPQPREVFKGEFNPVFQGVYSSRIELKQWMRSSQQRLTTAENLSSLAAMFGSPADPASLWRAWEQVLFNETHDLASGVMTDAVYRDTVRGYEFAKHLAEQVIDERWTVLASQIDTRGEGIPVVVFNTLGWPRADVAEATLGFAEDGVLDVGLVGPDGKDVPVQLTQPVRYVPEGGLKRVKITFVARDIPPMGYATYRAIPKKTAPPAVAAPGSAPDEMENAAYRMKFDLGTGEIKSLMVKDGNWDAFPAGGGNVVARQDDPGDLWELYKGLNGGQNLAMTNVQPVPAAQTAVLSSAFKGKDPGTIQRGPVFSEFDVAHPFEAGTFSTRVRLYAGLSRIDVRTQLVNQSRKVRYQALFPTGIKDGKSVHAIPFGAIGRPVGVEFPAQEWVDYGNEQHGLSLLNVGLPGNVVTDGTMMLSLMRAHDLGAYGFGGGYEPGMSSEGGMQLGKPFTLNYALAPHAGDWRAAGSVRQGMELNNPLLVRKAEPHEGKLPNRWGLLDISQPNVVLTAVAPGKGGATVFRVFESTGVATPGVKITLHGSASKAGEVNLMEDPIRDVAVTENAFTFDLKPFEIKTFSVQLTSAK